MMCARVLTFIEYQNPHSTSKSIVCETPHKYRNVCVCVYTLNTNREYKDR